LRNGRNSELAIFIPPSAQKLALLNVPDENLFVCSDNGLAGAGACLSPGRPDEVGVAGYDDAEGLGGFKLPSARVSKPLVVG